MLSGVLQSSVLKPFFLIFINDLFHDIKSEIKLFTHYVKLLIRLLLKETT